METALQPAKALSERIDHAFGSLLLAKDILDQFIPSCVDTETERMAMEFAEKLISLSVERLDALEQQIDGEKIIKLGTSTAKVTLRA